MRIRFDRAPHHLFSPLAIAVCLLFNFSPQVFAAVPVSAPLTATAPLPCDWGQYPCANFIYPIQGVMGSVAEPYNSSLSTVSYPGNAAQAQSDAPLLLPDGECYYIVNTSAN